MADYESADRARSEEAEEEILREGSRVAIKTAALIGVVEAVVVCGGVYLASDPLRASEELFRGGGAYWYEASMPAVLFALLGAALGCLLGWRITASSGLTGPSAWKIGLIAWSLIEGTAVVAALLIFGTSIPIIFWVAWAALSITGAVGITVFTVWTV